MSSYEERKAKRQEKYKKKEELTNKYMITLTWGVVGIIALLILRAMYRNVSTLVHMQTITWVLTGLFAVGAVVVFCLGKAGKIKNLSRAKNYSILLIVCAAVCLWLSLFNVIRPVMETVARTILGNPSLIVTSYWNIRIPMIAIIVYLIVAFIIYAIKVTRK